MKRNIEELVSELEKELRKNNKDKVKQHNKNFWLKRIKKQEDM